MPAYSFKQQFIGPIEAGIKKQTIRSIRKYNAKPGQMLYLFYAMRTKYCLKIKDVVCKDVKPIRITKRGNVYVDGKKLTVLQRDLLAYHDGFLADQPYYYSGREILNMKEGEVIVPASFGAFESMFEFFQGTHSLPFTGNIIYW